MKLELEAGKEPNTVNLWWKDEFDGKPYGAYRVLTLPSGDFQEELNLIVNLRTDTMKALIEQKEREAK